MFADFKSRFLWCIICTFLTGVITGINLAFIENSEAHIVFIIINLLAIIYYNRILKKYISRLRLQDKINSIYTDID